MDSKAIKKTVDVIIFILGTSIGLFGLLGFVSAGMIGEGARTYLFNKPRALVNSVEIEVDKDGKIYVGSSGAVQCFDEKGKFSYGIHTGNKPYHWGFDKDGKIYIVDGFDYQKYVNGVLVDSKRILDEKEKDMLLKQDRMVHSKETSVNGKEYCYTFRRITVTEADGSEYIIHLDVPTWPWPTMVYWLIALFGAVLQYWPLNKFLKLHA